MAALISVLFYVRLQGKPSCCDAEAYLISARAIRADGLFEAWIYSDLRTYFYPWFLSTVDQVSGRLSGGNTAAAVQFAADWRSKHKTDSQFINHLGESALVAGDLPAAEALFNQVVEIDSKKRQRTEQSGLPRPQASELEGLGTGRACVAAALNDPLVLDTLMRAYADKGQVDRAVEVQRRAVELAPRNGGLRLYWARLHLRNNSKERARQELQALAQLGPAFTAQDEVAALMREATR